MNYRAFRKLHSACIKSLSRFHAESVQTVNLAALAAQFPESMERQTALKLQVRREHVAQVEYIGRMRELVAIVSPEKRAARRETTAQSIAVIERAVP
jgi:hypothetical protein